VKGPSTGKRSGGKPRERVSRDSGPPRQPARETDQPSKPSGRQTRAARPRRRCAELEYVVRSAKHPADRRSGWKPPRVPFLVDYRCLGNKAARSVSEPEKALQYTYVVSHNICYCSLQAASRHSTSLPAREEHVGGRIVSAVGCRVTANNGRIPGEKRVSQAKTDGRHKGLGGRMECSCLHKNYTDHRGVRRSVFFSAPPVLLKSANLRAWGIGR